MVSKKSVLIALGFFVITVLLLSGTIMSRVDEPKYKVEETSEDIQIRAYEPMIQAQVVLEGVRKVAIRTGFLVIADYIFGNNESKKNGDAELSEEEGGSGEKISMTAPVLQQTRDAHKSEKTEKIWVVSFVMPQSHTLDTLPIPNDSRVQLTSLPAKRFAVIRFSGLADDESINLHLAKLTHYISDHKLKIKGEPMFAFYNPPWTLPILRRNEILLELAD